MGFVLREIWEEERQPGTHSAMQEILSMTVSAEDHARLWTLLMRMYGINAMIMKKEPWVIDAIADPAIELEI